PDGARELTVRGEGGSAKAAVPLKVRVVPLPRALRVAAPGSLDVAAGSKNQFAVRLARDYFSAPVTLKLDGAPGGLTGAEVVVPADRDEAEFEVAAAAGTDPATLDLKLLADAGGWKASAPFKVTVLPAPAGPGFSGRLVLVIGAWTALLAIGLSLALVAG